VQPLAVVPLGVDLTDLEIRPLTAETWQALATLFQEGTLSTFLRAGFDVARQIESKQATVVRSIVRLDLRPERESI
jgi:hypothetical protein